MTLMPPTRKRNRSCEEEDFLPLSKKINNLHINNWGNSHPEQSSKWNNYSEETTINHLTNGREENESRNSSPYKNGQNNLENGYSEPDLNEHYKHLSENSYKNRNYSQEKYNNQEGNSHDATEQQPQPQQPQQQQPQQQQQHNWPNYYNPDLGIDENPYYYESNKLLFGLYIERLQRGGY